MDDASELAAWSSASGVKILSIYERTGRICNIMCMIKADNWYRQLESEPSSSSSEDHADFDKLLRHKRCIKANHLPSKS